MKRAVLTNNYPIFEHFKLETVVQMVGFFKTGRMNAEENGTPRMCPLARAFNLEGANVMRTPPGTEVARLMMGDDKFRSGGNHAEIIRIASLAQDFYLRWDQNEIGDLEAALIEWVDEPESDALVEAAFAPKALVLA